MLGIYKVNHIKWGVIMAKITALCLVIMELTGQNQSFDQKSPLIMFFMFIAPLIVWWFGIAAKKKMLKGKISYKQAFTEGFKISLVYAVVSPFVFILYYLLVNQEILSYVRTAYQLIGQPDSVVILVDMIVQFLSALIFGSIYSAIISFFLKSKS